MPSTVSKLFVKAGDTVKKGDNLIALEAMKMEHLLKAGKDGKIKKVNAQETKFVEANAILIEFEE
jgi:3-methylcrotonyl-CoA carboxylase alpha subunit